jgi:hypothetical protein
MIRPRFGIKDILVSTALIAAGIAFFVWKANDPAGGSHQFGAITGMVVGIIPWSAIGAGVLNLFGGAWSGPLLGALVYGAILAFGYFTIV